MVPMAGGIALMVLGVWVCFQVLGGHALENLGIVGGTMSNGESNGK